MGTHRYQVLSSAGSRVPIYGWVEGVEVELDGDLDLQGFFGLSNAVSPGYSGIRAKVRLTAPDATKEQIEALHQTVVNTSPVGAILGRPVSVETSLVEG